MTMWNHKPEPDIFRKDMNLLKICGVVNQNRPDMIIFIKLHEADLQGWKAQTDAVNMSGVQASSRKMHRPMLSHNKY